MTRLASLIKVAKETSPDAPESSRKTHESDERWGRTLTLLLPALLGYGGAKLFGESDKTALTFGMGGLGLSSLAHVTGMLSGIARRPRTPEEQEEYNNSTGSTIANYLIPGVAAHNTGRRLRSALAAAEAVQNNPIEKSAEANDYLTGLLDKLKTSIYRHPTAWITGAGALAGGGLGALLPGRDKFGETHRLRNAVIGGLLGGGAGYGLGEYGTLSDRVAANGVLDMIGQNRKADAGEIFRNMLLRAHRDNPKVIEQLQQIPAEDFFKSNI